MADYIKRTIDIIISLLAIIFFSPVILLIYFFIKINFKESVFFRQKRIGKGGKEFYIYKIKTIEDDGPTKIGKFLRETFLDELPQFVNILKGEMSLVGPRPEIFNIASNYGDIQKKRLKVKPGLTGLWQISPYVNEPIHNHLEYDFYYINNWSLWLDLKIASQTIVLLSKRFKDEIKEYLR